MGRKTVKKEEDASAIDLTPMLDVVFIMLIFFIVTASFIKEAGVEVNRPEATTAELKKNANILVAINSNNEIWIDKHLVDVSELRTQLGRLYAENPKGAMVIQADDNASVETLTKVADTARQLGILDVSVATEKK